MKIAVISPDDLSTILFAKTLSHMLRETGAHELTTVGTVGGYARELSSVRSTHVDLSMDRFMNPSHDVRYLADLYRLMRRERFDGVLTFTTKPNIYGGLAARAARIGDITLAVRGLGRIFDPAKGLKDRALQEGVLALYKQACRGARLVWFINPQNRALFLERGLVDEDKTLLTNNAVNLSDYSTESVSPEEIADLRRELDLRPEDHVVLMVGRMIWQKGVREFCEAAEMLKHRLPEVLFVFLGPEEAGTAGAVPVSYVREMEKRGRLRWLGFRKDVRVFYALCSLAVLPSYYKEGCPRALIEPMAFGKPLIAADLEDCRDPVEPGKNGFLVPPRAPADLAEAIWQVMSDDGRRVGMGLYSREKAAREFDDRVVLSKLLERVSWGRPAPSARAAAPSQPYLNRAGLPESDTTR